jgi:hypothetical protein
VGSFYSRRGLNLACTAMAQTNKLDVYRRRLIHVLVTGWGIRTNDVQYNTKLHVVEVRRKPNSFSLARMRSGIMLTSHRES